MDKREQKDKLRRGASDKGKEKPKEKNQQARTK